jgi:hypothetical protein
MSVTPRPDHLSTQRFVVRPAGEHVTPGALPSLEKIGRVERLPSPRVGWVVYLDKPARSPRQGWEALKKQLGAGFLVVPVMDDEDGAVRYPTGLVTVRFCAPVSDADMEAFAHAHALDVVKRARFTRVQVLFRPAAIGEQFLPDVSEKLSASPAADAVWLDAESAYTRSA